MRTLLRTCAAVACFGSFAPPAGASTIFAPYPNFVQPDQHLTFDAPGLLTAGTTVQGITDLSGAVFNITGLEGLLTPSGSQLGAADGLLYQALIEALDGEMFFTTFEANLQLATKVRGTATITAMKRNGNSQAFTYSLGFGQNYFGLLAPADEPLRSVLIESTAPLESVRQIRIGGVQGASAGGDEGGSGGDNGGGSVSVPEPSLMLLYGMAAAAGLLRGRRRAKR